MQTYSPYDVSPETEAFSPELMRIVLEKVRYALTGFISPALLRDIRMRPDDFAAHLGKDIAYRIEGVVYGREARERTVERETKREKEKETDPTTRTTEHSILVPVNWRDHIWYTIWQWAARHHSAIDPMAGDEYDEDAQYPRLLVMRVRFWDRLSRWLRARYQGRKIAVANTNVSHTHVTNVTKHIEVHKHWHTCPHLNVETDRAHLEFLMDHADIR